MGYSLKQSRPTPAESPPRTSTQATMGDEPPTPGQVKVARQLLGWSQADVAGHVGLRKWTIGSFELDKPRWPRLDFASLGAGPRIGRRDFRRGNAGRSWSNAKYGSIGLQSNKTTLERAFELARSGKYRTIRELIRELSSEGYSAEQVEGKQVRTHLLRLMKAPKAEGDPVAENGEGPGVRLRKAKNE